MRTAGLTLAFALAVLFPRILFASDLAPVWDNLKSPVTTDAKYSLLVGAALVGTLLIFEDQWVDPYQEETVEDHPLGKFSKYGDIAGQGLPNALYVIGMLGYGYAVSSDQAKDNASSMFQATVYSVTATTVLKGVVREKRPDSSDHNSFPSGHTTAAFSFASYVGCRHSLPWGIAAYSLATFIAYSRINDNAHYLHDVVGGAAIGESYGLGICMAENRRNGSTVKPIAWYVAPDGSGVSGGVTLPF